MQFPTPGGGLETISGDRPEDLDRLEARMTPEQCEYLKEKGAIEGDWSPTGKPQPPMPGSRADLASRQAELASRVGAEVASRVGAEVRAALRAAESVVKPAGAAADTQSSAFADPGDVVPSRRLSNTERRILAFCQPNAHIGERIAEHLDLSYDHTRRLLARLVKEQRLRNMDDGYRTV